MFSAAFRRTFNGSAFEDIPGEHLGWCVLVVAIQLTTIGLYYSFIVMTVLSIFGLAVGVWLISAAYGFRTGFTTGQQYRPAPIVRGGSIGPPM